MTEEVKRILREEMDARGWHNNVWRAGLAAIVGGESRFIPQRETGWSRTASSRIRAFFSSRVAGMTDAEIDRMKADDRTWFNFIYSGGNPIGRALGNTEPEDGYRFRGGGLNQLTGRYNYATFGPRVGVDLIATPDMIVVPRIAAAVAVEYMKDRFKGGDFDAMKRAVGVSIGEPDDEKNRLYKLYRLTGEWDYSPEIVPPPAVPPKKPLDPAVVAFRDALDRLQAFLAERRLYTGPIGDGDPGPGTRAALKAYLKSME